MCYGQTGAGKTHTMSGGAWKDHGLIQDFFIEKVKEHKSSDIHVTLNQLHQSEIKDLFREGFEAPPQLKIHRRKDRWNRPLVSIENTTKLIVDRSKPADDLIEAINRGINNRKTRDNIDNETSSRSHVIFSIYVNDYGWRNCFFKYTFIDLAGAERVAKI
jgi:kinesin family protein 6/9